MKKIEKETLGIFPTPIYKLEHLSKELGVNLYIKRDDMCGVVLGGNKVRKLEYLLKDAKDKGYDLVMTTGQAQSNHATLTAACANLLGLDCKLVLKKRGITDCKGNQLLNRLMDVEVIYVDSDDYQDIYKKMDEIGKELNRKVYKIPCGGSNALGTLGYVDCIKEVKDANIHFDHITCAVGSGGTAAGTILGTSIYLKNTKVECYAVDNDDFKPIVSSLIEEAKKIINVDVEINEINIFDMSGPGYSIPSIEGNESIQLMMKYEGIVLDTCYTGKAFAGVLQKIKEGNYQKGENILFIHTGGAAGLFAQEW